MIKKIVFYLKSFFNICIMTIIYFFTIFMKSKHKKTWLIAERGYDAHDNGLVLYKYLKKNYPNQNIKYIIDKNNSDSKNIDSKDIVVYKSFKHYIFFAVSEALISTHIFGFSPHIEVCLYLDKKNIRLYRGKKVFLQHGIIKDNIKGLHYPNIKLDLFCCGALKEYNFVKDNFNFPKDVVQYTGLARYDNLTRNQDDEDFILIMPTWRKWLNDICLEEFKKSDYYNRYYHLLKKIDENQRVILCLHPEFIKFRSAFLNLENDYIKIANYNDFSIPYLLKKCKFLITDYSSVFFDVAYMNKNIIFYQFDCTKFNLEHYSKGYLNYNEFGYVCSTEAETLMKIKYCENNVYNHNYKFIKMNYFTYEFGNCQRIIKAIYEMLGEEENAIEKKYSI